MVLLAAIINQILTAKGKCPLPIEDSELSQLVSALFTAGAALWAWWKNNSFTKAAINADEVLNDFKGRKE